VLVLPTTSRQPVKSDWSEVTPTRSRLGRPEKSDIRHVTRTNRAADVAFTGVRQPEKSSPARCGGGVDDGLVLWRDGDVRSLDADEVTIDGL
jgi:hypothetical protein